MTFEYSGFRFQQRNGADVPQFCLFFAPAGDVEQWADVQRLGPNNPDGIQREPVPSRINAIGRYFDRDPHNTIPTAVVLALRGAVVEPIAAACAAGTPAEQLLAQSGACVVKIDVVDGQPRPALVIDGQHRLRGMAKFNPDLKLPIVAILEPTDLEAAFQFMVINNKSAKVPRDHIRALALNYEDDALRHRLESARLSLDENVGSVGVLDEDPESPFRGMIAWPMNPQANRVVAPSAIESIIGYVRSLGLRDLEEADGVNAFIIAMWATIKERRGDVFNADTHLLEKVGVVCLTQFIGDTMKKWLVNPRTRFSVGDPVAVAENTGLILDMLDPTFFQAKWASTSYDTRAGRDQIINALEVISVNKSNGDPWYQDVATVDQNWLLEWLQPKPADGA
jgi:DGQHR domain-containing protein